MSDFGFYSGTPRKFESDSDDGSDDSDMSSYNDETKIGNSKVNSGDKSSNIVNLADSDDEQIGDEETEENSSEARKRRIEEMAREMALEYADDTGVIARSSVKKAVITEDKAIQEAKASLERLKELQQAADIDLTGNSPPQSSSSSSSVAATKRVRAVSSYSKAYSTSSGYNVLTLAERKMQEASFIKKYDKRTASSSSSSSSSSSAALSSMDKKDAKALSESSDISVKVRFNGKYEQLWPFSPLETFGDLKRRIASFYSIAMSSIKLVIDGETIQDSEMAESYDIDDGDMVDGTVPDHIYTQNIEGMKTQQADVPKVGIKTVVNGSHERKWRVKCEGPLGELIAKFGEIYGLNRSDMIFAFAGREIADAETPESLDMEENEDNQVEVSIPPEYVSAALDVAEGRAAVPIPRAKPSTARKESRRGGAKVPPAAALHAFDPPSSLPDAPDAHAGARDVVQGLNNTFYFADIGGPRASTETVTKRIRVIRTNTLLEAFLIPFRDEQTFTDGYRPNKLLGFKTFLGSTELDPRATFTDDLIGRKGCIYIVPIFEFLAGAKIPLLLVASDHSKAKFDELIFLCDCDGKTMSSMFTVATSLYNLPRTKLKISHSAGTITTSTTYKARLGIFESPVLSVGVK